MTTIQILLFAKVYSSGKDRTQSITGAFGVTVDNGPFTIERDGGLEPVDLNAPAPHAAYQIELNSPAFGPAGPATANFIDFVQIWFPASEVTEKFKKTIEADFDRFDKIFKPGSRGDIGLAVGWANEEYQNDGVPGRRSRCFFVLRGWESMADFEHGIQQESYKEAIPILMSWNAPFKMWHVANGSESGLKV